MNGRAVYFYTLLRTVFIFWLFACNKSIHKKIKETDNSSFLISGSHFVSFQATLCLWEAEAATKDGCANRSTQDTGRLSAGSVQVSSHFKKPFFSAEKTFLLYQSCHPINFLLEGSRKSNLIEQIEQWRKLKLTEKVSESLPKFISKYNQTLNICLLRS